MDRQAPPIATEEANIGASSFATAMEKLSEMAGPDPISRRPLNRRCDEDTDWSSSNVNEMESMTSSTLAVGVSSGQTPPPSPSITTLGTPQDPARESISLKPSSKVGIKWQSSYKGGTVKGLSQGSIQRQHHKPSVAKYQVKEDILAHITGAKALPLDVQEEVRALWMQDKWANLIDPPEWLSLGIFSGVVKDDSDNYQKWRMLKEVSRNLVISQATSSLLSIEESNKILHDNQDWLFGAQVHQGADEQLRRLLADHTDQLSAMTQRIDMSQKESHRDINLLVSKIEALAKTLEGVANVFHQNTNSLIAAGISSRPDKTGSIVLGTQSTGSVSGSSTTPRMTHSRSISASQPKLRLSCMGEISSVPKP